MRTVGGRGAALEPFFSRSSREWRSSWEWCVVGAVGGGGGLGGTTSTWYAQHAPWQTVSGPVLRIRAAGGPKPKICSYRGPSRVPLGDLLGLALETLGGRQ